MFERIKYPSREELLSLLDYDPSSGIFRWKSRNGLSRWNTCNAGRIISTHDRLGYLRVKINGVKHMGHRIAWIICKGEDSALLIDHIDGCPRNNWISNLREATRSQNKANSGVSKSNRSGLKGATWHSGTKRWMSQITFNRKTTFLGYFDTAEDAHAKWLEAAISRFGPFARAASEAAIRAAEEALGH